MTAVAAHDPRAQALTRPSAGRASRSASSRSSSPCRRSMVRTPVADRRPRAGRGRGSARAPSRGGERRLGWGAIVGGLVGLVGGDRGDEVGRGQPQAGRRLGRAARLDAALRDAADLRRARRPLLRALRRHQHRARGDDADRRVLRRLGRGHHRLVGRRHRHRDRRRRAVRARSTRCSRSRCAPTRSSPAPR